SQVIDPCSSQAPELHWLSPVHGWPSDSRQPFSQPSPLVELPSSHTSPSFSMPLPHYFSTFVVSVAVLLFGVCSSPSDVAVAVLVTVPSIVVCTVMFTDADAIGASVPIVQVTSWPIES